MTDVGPQLSPRPGEHLKNSFIYQRNLNEFTPLVQSMLRPLSVPPRTGYTTTLDPISFHMDKGSTRNGNNPRQDQSKNLDAAEVSYIVGGMFTHWTNNTPRHHPTMEMIPFISSSEWNVLYDLAENILNTRRDIFINSVRHTVVKEALQTYYGTRIQAPYGVQDLPI
jgi:pyranose oxidase